MTALHALVFSVDVSTVPNASANGRHSGIGNSHRPPLKRLYTELVRETAKQCAFAKFVSMLQLKKNEGFVCHRQEVTSCQLRPTKRSNMCKGHFADFVQY